MPSRKVISVVFVACSGTSLHHWSSAYVPSIKISIGASLDADLNALFAPIEQRAEKARAAIQRSLNAAGKVGGSKASSLGVSQTDADGNARVLAKMTADTKRDAKERAKAIADAHRRLSKTLSSTIASKTSFVARTPRRRRRPIANVTGNVKRPRPAASVSLAP